MRYAAIVLLLACLGCAHATVPPAGAPAATVLPANDPGCQPATALVNATLWLQSAAESRAAARQAYSAARIALEAALADPAWVGALEEREAEAGQPPAIILDLDETVLDNSPFEARMIHRGIIFDQEAWNEWVEESAATALPGAADFLSYARERGVTPFYVTNRAAGEEAATRRNLERLGLPLGTGPDTLLVLGERPDWQTSDKSPRRASVARSHRVLMLVGDDLNDFVSARGLDPAARRRAVEEHAAWWGRRWILVPNPVYGSFERAVTGTEGTPCEQLQRKVIALRDRN
jgi:acid phosphatase